MIVKHVDQFEFRVDLHGTTGAIPANAWFLIRKEFSSKSIDFFSDFFLWNSLFFEKLLKFHASYLIKPNHIINTFS